MWAIAPTQDRDSQGNRVGASLKLPRIFIEMAGHHDSFVAFKMACTTECNFRNFENPRAKVLFYTKWKKTGKINENGKSLNSCILAKYHWVLGYIVSPDLAYYEIICYNMIKLKVHDSRCLWQRIIFKGQLYPDAVRHI